jgi:hypothetical protein
MIAPAQKLANGISTRTANHSMTRLDRLLLRIQSQTQVYPSELAWLTQRLSRLVSTYPDSRHYDACIVEQVERELRERR